MDKAIYFVLAFAGLAVTAGGQVSGQATSAQPDTLAWQILNWSPADQTSWINTTLDRGMPPDLGDPLTLLILNRSSLALPLIERKIEQVLGSQLPSDCFTDKSVDPQKFVHLAALSVAYAGNEDAMREVGKLIKIDEKSFGSLVNRTLMEAETRRNPYSLAYRGLELGNPGVAERIRAWAQARLADRTEFRVAQLRKWWAEAMVDRYNGVPTESQWATDPFVSQLNPSDEPALHKDMMGYAIAVVERRAKR